MLLPQGFLIFCCNSELLALFLAGTLSESILTSGSELASVNFLTLLLSNANFNQSIADHQEFVVMKNITLKIEQFKIC